MTIQKSGFLVVALLAGMMINVHAGTTGSGARTSAAATNTVKETVKDTAKTTVTETAKASIPAKPETVVAVPIAKPVATLTTFFGEAMVVKAGDSEAKPVKRGMFLFPGDRVKTKVNGRVEIRFIDGTMIRIAPDSDFEFKFDPASKKKSVFAYAGKVWNKVVKGTQFEVESSFAVCAVKGTEFDVSVGDQMQVWVADGLVDIQNDKGKVEAGKNTLTTIDKGVAPDKKPISQDQLPPRDEMKANLAAVLSAPGAKTEDEPFIIQIKIMDIAKNEIKRTNMKLKFLTGSEGIQVGSDGNAFKSDVEAEVVMGQAQIYAKAKPGTHELTVTGSDIPGTTFGVNVNPALKKREVYIDFTDETGQVQQLKLDYDLK